MPHVITTYGRSGKIDSYETDDRGRAFRAYDEAVRSIDEGTGTVYATMAEDGTVHRWHGAKPEASDGRSESDAPKAAARVADQRPAAATDGAGNDATARQAAADNPPAKSKPKRDRTRSGAKPAKSVETAAGVSAGVRVDGPNAHPIAPADAEHPQPASGKVVNHALTSLDR